FRSPPPTTVGVASAAALSFGACTKITYAPKRTTMTNKTRVVLRFIRFGGVRAKHLLRFANASPLPHYMSDMTAALEPDHGAQDQDRERHEDHRHQQDQIDG